MLSKFSDILLSTHKNFCSFPYLNSEDGKHIKNVLNTEGDLMKSWKLKEEKKLVPQMRINKRKNSLISMIKVPNLQKE